MRVAVLGGAGFLGSHVADALFTAGHDVIVFDRIASRYLRGGQEMITGDITDGQSLRKALSGCEAVYNFAGIADIEEAANKPVETVKYNVLGASVLLDECVRSGVKRVIFASTVYVYSSAGSFYRVSKQAAELLTEAFYERYGLEYTILRYGSLYGPRSDERNGIYRLLSQAVREGRITYRGNGEEVREYIHVLDAARLSVRMLGAEFANQHIILTGQQVLKGKDLLLMIGEMLGNSIEVDMDLNTTGTHYQITPYNYGPRFGKKLVSELYIDMGQGLLSLIDEITGKAGGGPQEEVLRLGAR